MSSVLKIVLCNILKEVKSKRHLTYKDVIEYTDGLVNMTQINNIINNDGYGVSCDVIYKVITSLDYDIEINIIDKNVI